jgi:transcriptional regulator with XRE-family HTH domain
MIGAILREARLESGKSLRDAGEFIGVSSSTISSYERGRKGISLPELELLAYFYQTPIPDLLSGKLNVQEESIDHDIETFLTLRDKMIGAALRQGRENAGMTIRQMAETLGIPTSRVSAYEHGKRSTPVSELEAMAEIFGHSVTEYVDEDGPVGEWIRERKAFDTYQNLPAEMQEFLANPDSERYLALAKQLSDISVDKLRVLADTLQDITL